MVGSGMGTGGSFSEHGTNNQLFNQNISPMGSFNGSQDEHLPHPNSQNQFQNIPLGNVGSVNDAGSGQPNPQLKATVGTQSSLINSESE